MKQFLFTCLLLSYVVPALAQAGDKPSPKLSPLTSIYLNEANAKGINGIVPGYVYKVFNGRNYISALIKVSNSLDQEMLNSLGVLVGTRAGDIWTTQVPVENILAFTCLRGISYIQLDEPVAMSLDSARKVTNVDSAHSGIGLPAPFFGQNVVMGVVDAGFDYTSPMLWDTLGTHYRVKRIWAQKAVTGTPPSGYIYGREITDTLAMIAAGTDQTNVSHGAHVIGICGGSGYIGGNDNRYRGMAPLSDLVMVGIMPQQQQWINTGGSDIIDGVHYIYQYATSVGKPAVVNLSWGASNGPHDGTSLFSQALDNLSGPGRIFVNSAGNSGDTRVHLKKTFTSTDTIVTTFPTYNFAVKKTWVDMWGEAGKNFCVKVTLYATGTPVATTNYVCMDGQVHKYAFEGSNGDSCFFTIVPVPSEFNGKPHVFISIYSKVAEDIGVTVKSTAGTVNMWNNYVEAPTGYIQPFINAGYPWATAGDTLQSISDNASSNAAITVGAFSSKLSWTTIGGLTYSYSASSILGNIAPFSSVGPTADGRVKPDISGPGYGVVSALNSFDPSYAVGTSGYNSSVVSSYHFPVTNRDYRYAIFSGTSMSSPAVAGIIALMLEANPYMPPQQVRSILNQTAIHDNFTGPSINNTWGGGKVNAYQAIKLAMASTGVGGLRQNTLACHLFPNPATTNFTIGYLGEKPEQLQISVYDVSGHNVISNSWPVSSGYNTRNIPTQSFAKGVYIVKVSSATGSSSLRLVVE